MRKLPPESLDLGFSALVDSNTPSEEASPTILNPSSAEDPFAKLFHAGEFRALAELAEKDFKENPISVLWWIRAQFHAKALPISILEAPLERVIDEVSNDGGDEIRPLLTAVFTEMALMGVDPAIATKAQKLLGLAPESGVSEPREVLNPVIDPSATMMHSTSTPSPRMLVILGVVGLVVVVFAIFYPRGSDTLSPLTSMVPGVQKVIEASPINRMTVSSLDALLSQMKQPSEKLEASPPPRDHIAVAPSSTAQSTKEVVDTTGPEEPRRAVVERPRDAEVVEQYTEFFKVEDDTEVLPRPSLHAHPITRLRRGAEVEVIGRSGSFLKIRGKSGDDAFVLARDVGKEPIRSERKNVLTPGRAEPPDPFSRDSVEKRYER